ncbi:MAG TPA: ATP-binding protein [Pyrinomonadaceae bacterium]|nr:ATP-binding protein [Pyrinomonadaceae bacterium]
MKVFQTLKISDDVEVGAARRAVLRYAEALEFTARELAELEIVAQELGTNAVRYATGGGCLHWTSPLGDEPGIELCYWDKGPGIHDLDRAVRDGVSTSGSLGGGLGAIQRLTDEFDVYSTLSGTTSRLSRSRRTTHGTIILARKWVAASGPRHRRQTALAGRAGVWSRPRPGEDANGDAYFVGRHAGSTLLAVVDGLGHGRGAEAASRAALDLLEAWRGESLDDVFHAVHDALRATRGGVMGACVVDHHGETFHYAGVGNVEVRVFDAPQPIRPVSVNGTLGARLSGVRVWSYPWAEGATIVMATDGISATWDIASYPRLLGKSPQLLAGVLLRDYGRTSDDATVLVAR